jgi:hypothetical protein
VDVATSAGARLRPRTIGRDVIVDAAFGLGAVALAGVAAVHIQQYASTVHGVRWIGPLFLATAAACLATVAGLAYSRTRIIAALAGVSISAAALGGLVISYGRGLFGWHEGGFRWAITLALITELAAVVLLAVGLAAATDEA